ncbi:sigma 54-interacting transcriptional regulator [Shewanella submarina]|uniref:Sigma 54-interacting transcriptional regulator n=1 Tax=Shewanella submarina TaxID=2016376 RepID=A0ABV7GCG2_9GAMM|nr:sigma 54-interacting transcriptional regulator [Shewanella submarina]MCL1039857.1 sigma 54-interacting transcriptional regulator [Shewanella submarina]
MFDGQTLNFRPAALRQAQHRQVLTSTLIFHPDLSMVGAYSQLTASQGSWALSRLEPGFHLSGGAVRPLADPYVSRSGLNLSKCSGGWQLDCRNSSTQVTDLNGHTVDYLQLSDADLSDGVVLTLSGRIVVLLHYASPKEPVAVDSVPGLLGGSDNMSQVRSLISNVADLKLPVLIRGESGTGKEVVANGIHNAGQRRNKPFVSVNMACIPRELASSELFGSVKGAFTGASSRDGSFQQADGGTLFLDELGEAPLEVQTTLLRALETGVVQAVGSEKPRQLDVRFVAATDANLEKLIGAESFKLPLLQRLSGLVIELLPLRERPEDFGVLFSHFLCNALIETGQEHKLLHAEADSFGYWAWLFARCAQLNWPGNVRQLRHTANQLALGLMTCHRLESFDWYGFVEGIANELQIKDEAPAEHKPVVELPRVARRKPRDIEDDEIMQALSASDWQIKMAADALGISRAALYLRIDASPALQRASKLSEGELQKCFEQCDGDLELMVERLQVSKQALRRRLNEIGVDCP